MLRISLITSNLQQVASCTLYLFIHYYYCVHLCEVNKAKCYSVVKKLFTYLNSQATLLRFTYGIVFVL